MFTTLPVRAKVLVPELASVPMPLYQPAHRGLAPQTLIHRAGRLDAGHTPLALDGGGQGAALAADEGTGAPVDVHMEAEAAAHDVVAQQTDLCGFFDGGLQPLHRQRIFGADVDIALGGAGGHTGDHHALQNGVGVALHDGAVHKRTGVTLVAVADHILHVGYVAPHALPFAPGGEAAAAAATEAGVGDLLADSFRRHGEQRLFKGGVAALGDVFVQILGIAGAAAGQHHAVLLFIEGDILLPGVGDTVPLIGQTLDDLAAHHRLFHDLAAVLRLDMDVHDAQRLDMYQRAHLAEAVAAAHLDVQALFLAAVLRQTHIDL